MCWNYVRRYWISFIIAFILVYTSYIVLHQKALENTEYKQRLDKIKPTVPTDLYDQLKVLKWRLVQEKFRSTLLQQHLLKFHKRMQKKEFSNHIKRFGDTALTLPSLHRFLPQINEDHFKLSKLYTNNTDPHTIIYGVGIHSFDDLEDLIGLLDSLFQNLDEKAKQDCLFVVYVNLERNSEDATSRLLQKYDSYVKSKLLDIIIPPKNYYPKFDDIVGTFGAESKVNIENMKSSLDSVFLMMYAALKGAFYVRLSAKQRAEPGYSTKVRDFAIKRASMNEPWYELSFTKHECFGKLYQMSDLSRLVPFILEYSNVKPCDWIIFGFVGTLVCNPEKGDCLKRIKDHRRQYRPVLFKMPGET
ncbi:alpha-1,3-mannosyl-glycoprotein 4-beta-N-acetylglucosaminyltransferase A-like [Clytia hemisphaerica]|uniref:MGAT4 conserved region domain-containing protein n=1 Tax=Clytia hemisphaerica TaxID=252671 RepID=A0A7M5TUY3_9CNID